MAGVGKATWVTSWRVSLCWALATVAWSSAGVLPGLPVPLPATASARQARFCALGN